MPVQCFAPITKDFATFDCDAHVTEPPLIWERAKDFLTRDELEALKATIWWDAESRLLIVNGRAGVGLGSPRRGGIPGTMRVITNAGPGARPWKNASAEDGGSTSAVRLRQGLRADPGTQARIACSSGPTPMMPITRLRL